jgi:hypothetical protein
MNMKYVLALMLALSLCAGWSRTAAALQYGLPQSAGTNASLPASGDAPIETGHYVNSAGKNVHRPAHTVSGNAPDGATAKCRDGSYSFSQSRRGTCSHHGGVEEWL